MPYHVIEEIKQLGDSVARALEAKSQIEKEYNDLRTTEKTAIVCVSITPCTSDVQHRCTKLTAENQNLNESKKWLESELDKKSKELSDGQHKNVRG